MLFNDFVSNILLPVIATFQGENEVYLVSLLIFLRGESKPLISPTVMLY